MKKLDRMGVLVLMAHLVITLAMIGVYALFAWLDKPVTTVENMLLIIVGYWFGAMQTNNLKIKPKEVITKEVPKKGDNL